MLIIAVPLLLSAQIHSASPCEWSGTGTDGGWAFSELSTPYRADGRSVAAQFGKGGSFIRSPAFDGDIVRVNLVLRSSPDPARTLKLVLHDRNGDVSATFPLEAPGTDRPLPQDLRISRVLRARALSLELSNGASGNWGLYAITVTTLADGEVSVPYDLTETRSGSHRLNAAWRNPDEVIACEMRVVSITAVPASAVFATCEDFMAITNTSRQSREVTDALSAACPPFRGERLYAPSGSTGEVTIGSSDYAGLLVRPLSDVPDATALVFRARRYPSRDEGTLMPVSWTDGHSTNALAVFTLTDDYADFSCPLEGLPPDATLILASTTNRATKSGANGRVIVDRMGLALSYVPAHATTNEIVRLATDRTSLSVVGLPPGTSGLWSVRGFDVDGNASAFADYVPFATDAASYPGTLIRLK